MRRIYSSLPVPSPAPNILGKIDRKNHLLRKTCRRHQTNISNRDETQLASVFFNQFPNYCQMVEEAKHRARRSILIDHCGASHIPLNVFRNVEQVYTIERESGRRGITKLSLIEFTSEKDAEDVSRQARHNEDRLMPVPMKIFRYPTLSSAPDPSKQDLPYPVETIRLSHRTDLSLNLKNYSDLVAKNTMSLVALKLRFVTLVNLEQVLCSGLFGAYELMPFGSSVIDTGSDLGDLDLVVTGRLDHSRMISDTLSNNQAKLPPSESPITLLHLDKSLPTSPSDRFGEMTAMKFFETIVKSFLPLTDDRAMFFPAAKVPIIRFKSRITAIDCDLSFNLGLDYQKRDIKTTNYSGIIMSQILYDICRKNNLFTAVVIYLRIYARITSITSKGPNVGFTNFQLLSLIIFYLQQISLNPRSLSIYYHDKNPPIIPPFKEIMNSRPIHLDDDQLNIVLPKVIKGFFEFYSNRATKFQKDKALNLYTSRMEKQPDNSYLYVVNPLDHRRNVCHNVCRKGLDHFVDECKQANSMLGGQYPRECPLSLMNNLLAEYQQRFSSAKALGWNEVLFEDDDVNRINRIDQPPKRLLN